MFFKKKILSILLFLISLLIVACGQPVHSFIASSLTAIFGFTCFWIACDYADWEGKARFWAGTFWFSCVQLYQFSWALTHPYNYIYFLWITVSLLIGIQFGLLSLFVTRERMQYLSSCLQAVGLWVILEWSRLFWFSGVSWNPVGLSLTASIVPLQFASIWGVYGLSFVCILTNILLYRYWCLGNSLRWFFFFALLPYGYGFLHYSFHTSYMDLLKAQDLTVKLLLVQMGTSVEETMEIKDPQGWLLHALDKWGKASALIAQHKGSPVDIIVLPEYFVPFGTFFSAYPEKFAKELLSHAFNEVDFPEESSQYVQSIEWDGNPLKMVSNAFFAQSIANTMEAEIVVGLEDRDFHEGERQSMITAQVFFPASENSERYAKRVLVPLGEYIPFEWCRSFAAQYGVGGSFCPGFHAKVINGAACRYGLSICYEETYGGVMRENRLHGADLLVNLTNDFWYPRSYLPQLHFDHARLRAVEMGIPLARAANSGLTIAVDSLGRIVEQLPYLEEGEAPQEALYVEVPKYHYQTLYSFLGENSLMVVCFLLVVLPLQRKGFYW